jgi:hypothetical protein
LLRGVSTQLVLTTTCFGRYIGHHQVVHSLILKQTIQYTLFFVFVNEISCTSIKSAFKVTTVAVELKSYSEIKDINSIKSWACDLGGGSYAVKLGIFLLGNTGFLWCHSESVAG